LRFVPWAFVLVNFSDPSMYHVWLGRIEYEVVKDVESEHYRKVLVQWWVLVKNVKNQKTLYKDCWVAKWKCNLKDPKYWFDIDLVTFSYPFKKNITNISIMTISPSHEAKAQDNFGKFNATMTNL
jgi:hypothetical protein